MSDRRKGELLSELGAGLNHDQVIEDALDEIFSAPRVQFGFAGNASATTISSSGSYVQVAGDITEDESSYFTVDTANDDVDYDGRPDRTFKVHVRLQATNAGAAAKSCTFGIAVNGSVDANTEQEVSVPDTGDVTESFTGLVTLSEGDTIRLDVKNNDDTTDLTVSDLNITVTEA